MRGMYYWTNTRLPDEAYEIPGVRVVKGGQTHVPWHAYPVMDQMGLAQGLRCAPIRRLLPTPLDHDPDPVRNHPFLKDTAKRKMTTVQREDLPKAIQLRGGLVDWPCVTGDALIHVHRKGKDERGKVVTRSFLSRLDRLVEQFNGAVPGGSRGTYGRWKSEKETFVHCMTDRGEILPGRLLAAVSKGVKATWKVTVEDGRSVTTTLDHVFLTPNGDRELGMLEPGHEVWMREPRLEGSRQVNRKRMAAKIVSIEYAGDQPVYDLTVETHHNFVANGFVVHNCGSGKTAMGLAFASAFPGYRSLIVAPSTTVTQWRDEAHEWLDTTNLRVGFVAHGVPMIKRKTARVYELDDECKRKLRRAVAATGSRFETLLFRDRWPTDALTEEELAVLRSVSPKSSKSTVWTLVDDMGNLVSEHNSEEEAKETAGDWTPGDYDILVIGWGLMPNPRVLDAIMRWKPAAVVVDEAHRGKGTSRWAAVKVRDSDTGEEHTTYRRRQTAAAHIQAICQQAAAVLLMTATPQGDRPKDWWGILDLYGPFEFGSFFQFSKRYCGGYQGPYGWVSDGLSNVDELKTRLSLVRFHRTRAETHKGLPGVRRQFTVLTLRDAGSVNFEALGAELRTADAGGSPTAMAIAVACEQKIPWAVDRIVQYMREGLKVSVMVLLRSSAVRLYHELLNRCDEMPKGTLILRGDGSTTRDERTAFVKQLVHNPVGGVIVGTLAALGEAIDGMQHFDRGMCLTVPWTPHMVQQMEGRYDRLGGKKSVVVDYVRMAGTIDDEIWAKQGDKLKMVGEVRDDEDALKLGEDIRGESPEAEAAALEAQARKLLEWDMLRSYEDGPERMLSRKGFALEESE